jgi:hypothetical protein
VYLPPHLEGADTRDGLAIRLAAGKIVASRGWQAPCC